MHRLIAILFVSLQLITSTEISQLMKLPLLIEHYRAHKASNPSLNFLGYLNEHYLNSDPTDPDYLTDMKLPFKTSSGSIIVSSCFSLAIISQFSVPAISFTEPPVSYGKYFSVWIPSGHLDAIFQPPRIS